MNIQLHNFIIKFKEFKYRHVYSSNCKLIPFTYYTNGLEICTCTYIFTFIDILYLCFNLCQYMMTSLILKKNVIQYKVIIVQLSCWAFIFPFFSHIKKQYCRAYTCPYIFVHLLQHIYRKFSKSGMLDQTLCINMQNGIFQQLSRKVVLICSLTE